MSRPWSASTLLFAYCLVVVQGSRDELVKDSRVGRSPVRGHLDRHDRDCDRECPGEERPSGGQVAPAGQPDVDDLPILVDRPVEVGPPSVDLDIRLVDEPAIPRNVPARSRRLDELRCEPLHPPVDRHVIDVHSSLREQLLDIPVGQAVPQVPTNRHRDHLPREPEPANAETEDEVMAPVSCPADDSTQQCP